VGVWERRASAQNQQGDQWDWRGGGKGTVERKDCAVPLAFALGKWEPWRVLELKTVGARAGAGAQREAGCTGAGAEPHGEDKRVTF
jgi:hypothetical protein